MDKLCTRCDRRPTTTPMSTYCEPCRKAIQKEKMRQQTIDRKLGVSTVKEGLPKWMLERGI